MRGEERRQQAMLMVIDAERRVPKDHPLQRIKQLAEAARRLIAALLEPDELAARLHQPHQEIPGFAPFAADFRHYLE